MAKIIKLISHPICPYVQRVAILLNEKGLSFERLEINLNNKPSWFLEISPLGKTPVLLVNDQAIFDSLVICEYLDEAYAPPLHPSELLRKAQHRSWIEFGNGILATISVLYNTKDLTELNQSANTLSQKFKQLEEQLGTGPYFEGEEFSLIDAVYGPIFRYFDVLDKLELFPFFKDLDKVPKWRSVLSCRPSIKYAVSASYEQNLYQFLISKPSKLAHIMDALEGLSETIH
jgi:glutathione S-transferase